MVTKFIKFKLLHLIMMLLNHFTQLIISFNKLNKNLFLFKVYFQFLSIIYNKDFIILHY